MRINRPIIIRKERDIARKKKRERKLRGQDSNLRPRGYEPRELPDCSTPRQVTGRSDQEPARTLYCNSPPGRVEWAPGPAAAFTVRPPRCCGIPPGCHGPAARGGRACAPGFRSCPAPPGAGWRRLARRFHKRWIHVPLGQFSQATVQQLRMVHVLNGHQVRSFAAHFIRRA